jgi:DNA mismatch repair ATPase MutS
MSSRAAWQVGDFYESFGFDAIILAQYCNLRPMKNSQAKAGFPKPNLVNYLQELVMDYGFSVVVRIYALPFTRVGIVKVKGAPPCFCAS